jgi:hypothetical protein
MGENSGSRSLGSRGIPHTYCEGRFLGDVSNPEHIKELHCNAYGYIHGHSLGGTNPALLKGLGFGNCVFALNTAFNREVFQDYGILSERDILGKQRSIGFARHIAFARLIPGEESPISTKSFSSNWLLGKIPHAFIPACTVRLRLRPRPLLSPLQ